MSANPQQIQAQTITADNFKPYGQVVFSREDHQPYGPADAQLVLQPGPRLYLMRLQHRGRQFDKITRHLKCTQCLGSLAGKEWLIAVAPPSVLAPSLLGHIVAFQIPGDCFIKLDLGTWHAGPYFEADFIDFYNLELSDTNINDHDTCNLQKHFNVMMEIL